MGNYNITAEELHAALLSILTKFHEFAVKHNIEYYMIGGTALGAVRHKGFIPWDDDVDIALKREEYNKLLKLSHELPEGLEIVYRGNNPKAPTPYIKIVDNKTTLIENNYRNFISGLYIDAFPLDYVEDDVNIIKIKYRKIRFLFGLFMTLCSTQNSTFKRKIIKQLFCYVNSTYVYKIMEEYMCECKNKQKVRLACYLGAYGIKENYETTIFGKPKLYDFENHKFYGPTKIEEYLKITYGDYMKLPKEEDRVFKHAFYHLDLKTSYKDILLKNT